MHGDVEARLDRLESIEAIKRLKHSYMAYCDEGYPPEKIGPLFAEDALWTNEVFGRHEGRAAIEAFFAGISAQIVFAAHLAMNFMIEVDGDRGTGRWRMLMPCTMMEDGRQVSRWILGDYDEAYVRRDGRWLFQRVDFFMNFNVPHAEDWAGQAAVRG